MSPRGFFIVINLDRANIIKSVRIEYQCLHAAYLEYNWNGRDIDAVFEVLQIG